jgi:hypothetical protein
MDCLTTGAGRYIDEFAMVSGGAKRLIDRVERANLMELKTGRGHSLQDKQRADNWQAARL